MRTVVVYEANKDMLRAFDLFDVQQIQMYFHTSKRAARRLVAAWIKMGVVKERWRWHTQARLLEPAEREQ